METYWVWEYGLFEKNPKRQDSLNPETTLEVVKAADAQATIAALQARVRELEESRDAWRASQECSEKAYMALVNQIPAERFDYDPVNVALLDGAKEQEIIGRKQIADLKAALDAERQQHTQLLALVRAAVTRWQAQINVKEGVSFRMAMKALEATLDATTPTIEQEIEQIVEEAGNPVWPKGGDGE